MEWIEAVVKWIGSILKGNISAITGLLGVWLGVRLSNKHQRSQRKLDFYRDQLNRFYSPMVGIRKEIKVLSEFRVASDHAAHEWWQRVCERGRSVRGEDSKEKIFESERPKIQSKIQYENEQLETRLLPVYKQMLEVFKNNYWFATEATRKYYPTLIKYIESWDRFLSHTHAVEIVERINVPEEELLPFYADLEENLERLRKRVEDGSP